MDDQDTNQLIRTPSVQPDSFKGIKFTPREIDVLACILGGRTGKKMAALLSLSPKTVENYIHTIMQKLECSSREGIKDWLETCEEIDLLKKHYSEIFFKDSFEKHLKDLITQRSPQISACSFIYWLDEDKDTHFISQLEKHLKLAGVTVSSDPRVGPCSSETLTREVQEAPNCIIVVPSSLKDTFVQSKQSFPSDHLLLLIKDKKQTFFNFVSPGSTEGGEQNNYHGCLVELLKHFFPDHNFSSLLFLIKKHYQQTTVQTLTPSPKQENKTIQQSLAHIVSNRKWQYSFGVLLLIGLMIVLLPTLKMETPASQVTASIRSDLVIPTESAFLNRSELIAQMDDKFRGQKGIQTLALVGVGGAGKTTLARQYTQHNKANVVWEINAETRENLNTSFETLASTLAKVPEEKKELKEILDIKNAGKREEKLIQFVKAHLKATPDWFLIFDNVEKFTDIQPYFPQDTGTWGQGQVILTTRDRNIENNSQVNAVLSIGELNPTQKLTLFTKIMNHGTTQSFTVARNKEAKKFLENIPPFPLDVSVAAYYLKITGISYDNYLTNLEKYQHDFASVQENLLKEAGTYVKTRYGIITLSLEEIIKAHKDFGELLLFISLLDSQQIPKDLIDTYKGAPTVDNFIYHLKKYSLITSDPSSVPVISIHRSTQEIIFAYLSKRLKFNKNSQLLTAIAYTVDDYVDQALEQEDFLKIRLMASHLEKFLTYSDLFTDFSKGLLESKIGSIYYFINDEKSKIILKDSLNILERNNLEYLSSEDVSRLARSFLHIGAVYTELRLDKEAEDVLNKAVRFYGKESSKKYLELSRALSHLGDLQKRLGNYEEARNLLEESIKLHKQYGANTKHIARTLAYLGSVYRGLGLYQKAINTLEESLAIYEKNYSNDHIRRGWILIHLGNVYRRLGNLKQAKDSLEKGLIIFQKHFPENHVSMGLVLAYLGGCYRDLGDYEKSRDYLEHSSRIHQKHFDENHVKMGWILFHLARTYKAMGDNNAQGLFDKVLKIYTSQCHEDNIETARMLRNMAKICIEKNRLGDANHYIQRSLKILQLRHHVEAYKSLETLGEILLKKRDYAQNNTEIQDLKNQAIEKFNQALKIAEQNFPKDSIHIKKIQDRIQGVENKI